jgi:hypothetical protein
LEVIDKYLGKARGCQLLFDFPGPAAGIADQIDRAITVRLVIGYRKLASGNVDAPYKWRSRYSAGSRTSTITGWEYLLTTKAVIESSE